MVDQPIADGDVAVHQVGFVELGQADGLALVGLLDHDCLEFRHGRLRDGFDLSRAAAPGASAAQAGTAAGRGTGFSTIGRLMIAEATPKKIAPHQTTS